MLRFAKGFVRRPRPEITRARRLRSYNASPEALEGRKLMAALTSVTYNSGGVAHSEVFALNFDNTVSMSKDGGSFVSQRGYLKSISAGLDSYGNPEVYGIGGNDAVWVNDNGAGWVSRGGFLKSISATTNDTVFGIGGDDAAYINWGGSSWTRLGGNFKAISAGVDYNGSPEVYGIDTNTGVVLASDNGAGFVNRSGYLKSISATTNDTVFGIGGDDAAYINRGGSAWTRLGGNFKAISAGVDYNGSPEVYAIGTDAATYVSDNGYGFGKVGGYVTEISGTGSSTVFARGASVEQVFVSHYSSPFNYIASVGLVNPASARAYSAAPSTAALFNNGQPSYLDMEQGAVGDCWLDASLAEVADRYPQDIKNMFTYQGTTVDNGATVGLYSVRFFSPNGVGFYVQVDTAFPNGGGYYNRVGNALGTQSLWTALAEKGYAEANALGLVTTGHPGKGSYASLDFGSPTWALQAITGRPSNGYAINPTDIATAWNSGQLIVLCTSSDPNNPPPSSLIVPSHCYAVVDYNASSGQPFMVFNPWGTQSDGYAPNLSGVTFGRFTANSAFMSQNFTSQSIGSGAINDTALTDRADETTETATQKIAAPRKLAIVLGNGHSRTVFGHIRPTLGMVTIGGPLS